MRLRSNAGCPELLSVKIVGNDPGLSKKGENGFAIRNGCTGRIAVQGGEAYVIRLIIDTRRLPCRNAFVPFDLAVKVEADDIYLFDAITGKNIDDGTPGRTDRA